jgi:hypothetical protein
MPRTVIEIYAALVCFVSIACLAIGVGNLLYGAIGVAYPSLTLNPMNVPLYQDVPFEMPTPAEVATQRAGVPVHARPRLTEEEIAKRRAIAIESATQNERQSSLQSLLRWAITSLVSGVLFFTHWRLLRRGRAGAA